MNIFASLRANRGRMKTCLVLTSVAQLVECQPAKQEVAGLIPGQGIWWGCRFCAWSGQDREAADQ